MTTVPSTTRGFLLPYAHHLRRSGWTVEAASGSEPALSEIEASFDAVWEVPWTRRLPDPANALQAPLRMRRLLLSGRYDVVHTHTPIASAITRAAVASLPRASRPAVVYTAHGFHFHPHGSRARNAAYAAVERLAGLATDRLVVINELDRDEALRRRIVPPERLVLMPGIGIDLDHYRATDELLAAAQDLRTRLGIGPDTPLVTVVAELVPRKNHRTLLEALAAAGPDLHACLVGEGPLRAELQDRAEQLGVASRTHLLGRLEDVRPAVLASTATVLPSWQEGLSRAVLESLALGVPVVGGRTRGITELVEPDGGVLVPPGDPPALARALATVGDLPRGPELRARLDTRLRRCSIEALLAAHDSLYADLLRQRARAVRT
ncbi:glycosyltransferase [Cellulomonas aerilata]|uniref:glycosyltransferase n=1 Tax=Cellulomonas aerilata TaxID=515326 RepID=UPI001649BEC5|nr:glycosyltransferase [Cellulomonas aerilata]